MVCVQTDKTNSTKVIQIEDYKRWVYDHLLKAADLALRAKVVALFEDANCLLDKVKMELSVQEENFVRQSLAMKAIPVPKLLIKYHKTINEKGEFPTRLVIPVTKFTATLSKTGYLGIKRCLDKRNSELFTFFHCPGLRSEREIGREKISERGGNNQRERGIPN